MDIQERTLERRAAGLRPAVSAVKIVNNGRSHGGAKPRRSPGFFFAPLSLALSLLSGCVALDGYLTKSDEPPTGTVCQVVTTWQKEVMFAPDTIHGGRPVPGLMTRIYLFGPEIKYPLAGDGSVTVQLLTPESPSEKSPPPPDAAFKVLEVWQFDPATLHGLLHKDTIGYGYTLFLPWGTYRSDIKDVRMRVCYQAPKATPLYSETPLTLAKTGK